MQFPVATVLNPALRQNCQGSFIPMARAGQTLGMATTAAWGVVFFSPPSLSSFLKENKLI